MTSADGKQLVCFKCGKPGQAPDLMPYYTVAGHKWFHMLCAPIPETQFSYDANGSPV